MKKLTRMLAVFLAMGVTAIWLATGAHRGWTVTEVPNTTLDEVTGLTGGPPQKKFVAGVDFLVAGFLVATILAGVSFFFRPKSKSNTNQNQP